MSSLSAAFEGASQGLDQLASAAMQREMMEAQMMRAENLAQLRDYLDTRRQLIVTNARGQVLNQVSQNRISAEHGDRDEEIDRQEAGRAANERSQQGRALSDAEHLQDNAFTNQAELQARAAGRTAQVQASRDAILQANQARQQKAAIRTWLTKYQAQSHVAGGLAGDPLDSQQLAQLARHDSVLASQLQAYKDADTREQAATRAMGKFPGAYDTPSTPGAVAPAADSLLSPPKPPTSSLIPIPSEGPGIADQPYPDTSASDSMYLSSPMDDGGASAGSDDDNGGGND